MNIDCVVGTRCINIGRLLLRCEVTRKSSPVSTYRHYNGCQSWYTPVSKLPPIGGSYGASLSRVVHNKYCSFSIEMREMHRRENYVLSRNHTHTMYVIGHILKQGNSEGELFNMNIGIIEDDAYISDILKEYLQRLGHTPTFYHDGWTFIESLTNEQSTPSFDRIIVDVLLPGNISGHEVINYLRINRPHLPVVVISAIDSEDLRSIQRQFPGVKILHKPFHLHDLRIALETA